MGNMYCDREQQHRLSAQRAKEGVLGDAEVAQMCKTFQLLSDPGRMKIVLALMNGEMCVYHITEACGGSVSGVSHQLRLLRDNGIVRAKRFGKNVEYSIADGHVCEIIQTALAHLACDVGDAE